MGEKSKELVNHALWIGTIVKRIIDNSMGKTKPLLCLSFLNLDFKLNNNSYNFENGMSIDELKTGVPYAIIISTIEKTNIQIQSPDQIFTIVLKQLKNHGYSPSSQCNPQLLPNGDIISHIELCKIIEWMVIDKSISIQLLSDDLNRLPRSFYILKQQPNLLEDAISLWLSKFPCSRTLPPITNLEKDILEGQHAAFVLSRAYPKILPKDMINVGIELTDRMISQNWERMIPLMNELSFFIPNREYPLTQNLIILFVTDLFYATRNNAKQFIKLEPPPPIEVKITFPSKETQKPKEDNKERVSTPTGNQNLIMNKNDEKQNLKVQQNNKPKVITKDQKKIVTPKIGSTQNKTKQKNNTNSKIKKEQIKNRKNIKSIRNGKLKSNSSKSSSYSSLDIVSEENNLNNVQINENNSNNEQIKENNSDSNQTKTQQSILLSESTYKQIETSIQDTKSLMKDDELQSSDNSIEESSIVTQIPLSDSLIESNQEENKNAQTEINNKTNNELKQEKKFSQTTRPRVSHNINESNEYTNNSGDNLYESSSSDIGFDSDSELDLQIKSEMDKLRQSYSITQQNKHKTNKSDLQKKFENEASLFNIEAQRFILESNLQTLQNRNNELQKERNSDKLKDLNTTTIGLCFKNNGIDVGNLSEEDLIIINKSISEFSQLSDNERNLEHLYKIISSYYSSKIPIEHIDEVFQKVQLLLEKVATDSSSIPHLLISVANNLFNHNEETSSSSDELSHKVITERSSIQSQTNDNDKRFKETQTNINIEYNNANPLMQITKPVSLFNKPHKEIPKELIEKNDPSLKCNISINFVPFYRFSSFKRVMSPQRNTRVISNFQVITQILRFIAMPSPQQDLKRKQIINFLSKYKESRIVILLNSMNLKMKGIYLMNEESTEVTRVWGIGPTKIVEKDIGKFYKFITGSKFFEEIPTKHLTQTTDAISLNKKLEPRSW